MRGRCTSERCSRSSGAPTHDRVVPAAVDRPSASTSRRRRCGAGGVRRGDHDRRARRRRRGDREGVSRAGRRVSAARPSRSRGGALSGGAVARHRCSGDAPRRDDGPEPRRHRDGARRPRQGAARPPHEPRRVPHARRAEGGARLPARYGSALHRPRAMGRLLPRVRRGGADGRGARRPPRTRTDRGEARRAGDRARRLRRRGGGLRDGARARGAVTGGRRRRRDREASRNGRARDGRAGGRRRALRARTGDRRRTTRPPAVGGDGARARRDCAASRDVIATRSCISTAAIASSRSSPRSARWRISIAARRASSGTSSRSSRHWAGSIESKDRYTQGHCERVADLACALAIRAGCEPRELFWFRIGATVHDVGKLIIPSEVLNKPGKLVARRVGADQAPPGRRRRDARRHGLSRRRHSDGALAPRAVGRPRLSRQPGRRGNSPRGARILCIADVYDALTLEAQLQGRAVARSGARDHALRRRRSSIRSCSRISRI